MGMSSFEPALRQYFSEFDGTKKEFSTVEAKFNHLYHDKFHVSFEDGEDFTRDEMKDLHTSFLTKGATVKIHHIRHIGLDTYDVKLVAEAEGEEDKTVHMVYTISDKKIIKAQEVDAVGSIMKAAAKSGLRIYQHMATYGTVIA